MSVPNRSKSETAAHLRQSAAVLFPAQATRAAEILRSTSPEFPLDAALREYFASHRYLSPEARRELARATFAFCRWRRWADEKAPLPAQISSAYAAQERFERSSSAFKAEALVARAVPDWLHDELTVSPSFARQLQREPVLWLRARAACLAEVQASLAPNLANAASQLPAVLPLVNSDVPSATAALRCSFRYSGAVDLYRTEAFRSGAFEIQDLASQLVGLACAPKPGETWWDACAGEGGKTLHLADLMQGKGLIWASDRSTRRLGVLRTRAGRAQVFNYRSAEWDGSARLPTRTKFDGILVDAPCSGVGTWQRNPHARWTTTPHDVRELAEVQRRLLDHAVTALKPGGRLVFSVCTLTRSETSALVASFVAAHPGVELVPAFPGAPVEGVALMPEVLEANGMFIACFRARD